MAFALHEMSRRNVALDTLAIALLPGDRWEVPGSRDITLRHLLSHRSGMPSSVGKQAQEAWSPEALEAFTNGPWGTIFAQRLADRPGGQAIYSDLNYIVLARILSTLTGHSSYADALRPFLSTLGSSARFGSVVVEAPPTSADHDGRVHDPKARAFAESITGSAGIRASANDVAALLRLFMTKDNGIFSENLRLEAVTEQSRTATGERYGLGLRLANVNSSVWSPFAYGGFGFTGSSAFADPARNAVMVLLTNAVRLQSDRARVINELRERVSRLVTNYCPARPTVEANDAFCNFPDAQAAPLLVTPHFTVFPDLYSIMSGHLLVVPRGHVRCMADLDMESIREMESIGNLLEQFFLETYRVGAVLWESGIHGQTQEHAHLHAYPLDATTLPPFAHGTPVTGWDAVQRQHLGVDDLFNEGAAPSRSYHYLGANNAHMLLRPGSPDDRVFFTWLAEQSGVPADWHRTFTSADYGSFIADVHRRWAETWAKPEFREAHADWLPRVNLRTGAVDGRRQMQSSSEISTSEIPRFGV